MRRQHSLILRFALSVWPAYFAMTGSFIAHAQSPQAKLSVPTPLSVEVDPAFAYYKDRSAESIAAEIAAQGYKAVRYEVTADSDIRRDLIDAYHRHGMQVWYVTFLNGTYSRKDLPAGWEAWKMVNRSYLAGKPINAGYDFLCLNNVGYRGWKKARIVATLQKFPFDGIDLKEPFWPDFPGVTAPTFGCFCPACRKAFARDLPDILHDDAPNSAVQNPRLWQQYLQFRRDSLVADLGDIINGPKGIREQCPTVKVDVWSLALLGNDGRTHVRDDNGEDAAQLAHVLSPDALCLETHWPDWGRPNLPADYVKGYKPFLEAVRDAGLSLPVFVEADTGSLRPSRRGERWISEFTSACSEAGFAPPVFYEYSIGLRFYEVPIRIQAARRTSSGVELIFSRRPDPAVAGEISHYRVTGGHVTSIRGDGATVDVHINGLGSILPVRIIVIGLRDLPQYRLYPGDPPVVSQPETVRIPSIE